MGLIQMAWNDLFNNRWAPFLVTGIAIASLLLSIEFYRRFAPAVKPPETLSSDALVGRSGTVVRTIDPDSLKGKVKIGGIVWSATGPAPVEEGTEVIVTAVEGVHLVVQPTTTPPSVSSQAPTPG